MADVAIIHSAEKQTAAARLAEAVAAAGFDVAAVQIEEPGRLVDAVGGSGSEARILIWSKSLVVHMLHSGELPRIRQLRGLIEVSADGITPPSGGDESRVVLIAGWRGQPFHPGWQRIHAELKRLCGPRKPASDPSPPPSPSAKPPPQHTAPAAPGVAAGPRAGLILGAGAAILLVAAAVGGAIWVGGSAPDDRPRQEFREARRPAGTAEAPPPARAAEPEPAGAVAGAQPAGDAASPPSSGAAAAAEAVPDEARPARPKPVARARERSSPPAGPIKKYSRKNSKVMRQFCERSGRSTPQCRTFLRSILAEGGETTSD
jgi:hypothetical protein